jgi:5-methylcytosine-specific restriction endonuclease McrBC regulatory subunit McrC
MQHTAMKQKLHLKDNRKTVLQNFNNISDLLKNISGVPISELLKNNPNIGMLPFKNSDDILKKPILNLVGETHVQTNNIMGFLSTPQANITIGSRFSKSTEKELFLQHMLLRVGNINQFTPANTNNENIWDFILFLLFPIFLKKAASQGIYKCYKWYRYNDANVKGRIDIKRHIKQNLPFVGNVAYNTKEFSLNNNVTQIIRHTIAFIKSKGYSQITATDSEVINAVKAIETVTPDYQIRDRQKVMLQNREPIRHPYFDQYEPLRKICLQILRNQGNAFNDNNDEVYGLLIDGAWLWEEYLNTFIKEIGITHAENNLRTRGLKLFEKSQPIYPDFYSKEKSLVIDAKYKRLSSGDNLSTSDLYQVITYMYRLRAKNGILLYPQNENSTDIFENKTIHQDSYGEGNSSFGFLGMYIPDSNDYEGFKAIIEESEKDVKNRIKKAVLTSVTV